MASNIHANLKEARLQKGLSQNDVANQLHISRQAISRWENGKARPDIDNLRLLSKLYGVSVDQLLGVSIPSAAEASSSEKTSAVPQPRSSSLDVELILYLIILAISTQIAILGFIISIPVTIWLSRCRPQRKLCFLFAIGCCCINFFLLGEQIYLYSPFGYSTTIEKISFLLLNNATL